MSEDEIYGHLAEALQEIGRSRLRRPLTEGELADLLSAARDNYVRFERALAYFFDQENLQGIVLWKTLERISRALAEA